MIKAGDMNVAHSRQAARAAALAQITRAIAASLDVSKIFSVIAQEAGHILAHDALVVLFLHAGQEAEADRSLAVAFCHPPIGEAAPPWPLTAFSFVPALLANQPVVIEDIAATASRYAGDQALLDNGGRAAVIVPIQAISRVLGGIVLISRTPGLYGPGDALLVEPIAGLLALALEHQRLDQQANALAVVEERNRLAREIHDTLAHSLTGILLNLESLKPYDATRSQGEAEVLAETETLARRALAEARRSVLGLHPTPLQHQSLHDALTPELAGLAKRAGLASQFYVHGTERPLAPDVATALFRVAQEAFHNIHKHAAARHVILGLSFAAEVVVLTIEDDGVGFVPQSHVPHGATGFGLLSMAARARSLGGELLATSRPGHGTTVRATLPDDTIAGRAGSPDTLDGTIARDTDKCFALAYDTRSFIAAAEDTVYQVCFAYYCSRIGKMCRWYVDIDSWSAHKCSSVSTSTILPPRPARPIDFSSRETCKPPVRRHKNTLAG